MLFYGRFSTIFRINTLSKKFVTTNFKKLICLSDSNESLLKKEDIIQKIITSNKNKIISEYKTIFESQSINILESSDFNLILNEISGNETHVEYINTLLDYILENNVKLDSLGYSFLINYFLKLKRFRTAYMIFLKSSYEDVQLTLSTYFKIVNFIGKQKLEYKNELDFISNKMYPIFGNLISETLIDMLIKNIQIKHKNASDSKNKLVQDNQTDSEKEKKNKYKEREDLEEDEDLEDDELSDKIKYRDMHKLSKKIKLKNKIRANFSLQEVIDLRNKKLEDIEDTLKQMKIFDIHNGSIGDLTEFDKNKIQILHNLVTSLKETMEYLTNSDITHEKNNDDNSNNGDSK